MAKVKCEYCGAFIDDSEEKCPNCNAVNANFKRYVPTTPKTIEELKGWYAARNLPDESITRFFIGKDIKEPKAFGIYKDGENFIVYKNKANGSRAIRYKGTDEAYAVNELYLKLKSEILNQKSRNISRGNVRRDNKGKKNNIFSIILFIIYIINTLITGLWFPNWVLFILLALGITALVFFERDHKKLIISLGILIALSFGLIFGNMFLYHRHDGYYSFKNAYYYVQGRDIYYYDDYGWSYYDSYDNFSDYADYTYISDEYIESEPYSDFSESFYYDDGWSSSSSSSDYSSYDNDYDWDSGSDWDSGGSDWDSDW